MAYLIQIILLVFSTAEARRSPRTWAEFPDPHPFQMQGAFRFPSAGDRPGLFEVPLPAPIPAFQYRLPDGGTRIETGAMLLLDKRNSLPGIRHAGMNYYFFVDGSLATISAEGTLFYRGFPGVLPAAVGGVYFVDAVSGELCVVDTFGYWMRTGIRPGELRVIGGNYLINREGVLITIRSVGAAPGVPLGAVTRKDGWSFDRVTGAGGNFFWMEDGSVFTIDSRTGFFLGPVRTDSPPRIAGGNYFIAQDGVLYTVGFDGRIFRNPAVRIEGGIRTPGPAFFQLRSGELFLIDASGTPHRSWVRVSSTGVRAERMEKFETDPEPGSWFEPGILK